jgi:hypothetical protein
MTIGWDIGSDVRRRRHPANALAQVAFGRIVKSAVGVVRESAGLICNVAGLGVAMFVGTTNPTPPLRARAIQRTTNVIPFPERPKQLPRLGSAT